MEQPKKVKVPTIGYDKIADLKVSGAFYRKIVGAYFTFVGKIDQDKVEDLFKAIKDKKIESIPDESDRTDAGTLEMFIILIQSLEEDFKAKGFIVDEEIEIPSNEG